MLLPARVCAAHKGISPQGHNLARAKHSTPE